MSLQVDGYMKAVKNLIWRDPHEMLKAVWKKLELVGHVVSG